MFLVLIELNELPSFVSSLVFFICSHPRENMSFTFHCFCHSFSVTELREDFSPRPVRLLGAGDSPRGRSNVVGDTFSTSALPPFNSLQVIMSRARHKCIQCDGSRHGRKDALCIALGAFDPCAPDRFRTHKSAKAPPKQQSENTSNFD